MLMPIKFMQALPPVASSLLCDPPTDSAGGKRSLGPATQIYLASSLAAAAAATSPLWGLQWRGVHQKSSVGIEKERASLHWRASFVPRFDS